MKLKPIVEYFLDSTDWYKMTMGAAILRKFPDTWVKWKFKCRNKGIVWTKEMVTEINEQLDHLCALRVTEREVQFVKSIRYIPKGFPEFLRMLQLDRSLIKVRLDEDGVLHVIAEGPWFLTTYFEIPVLAIVNEVYFHFTAGSGDSLLDGARALLAQKIEQAKYHVG